MSPVFHAAVDACTPSAHDEPQNFGLPWARFVDTTLDTAAQYLRITPEQLADHLVPRILAGGSNA